MIDGEKASSVAACNAITGLQKGAAALGEDAESSGAEETTVVRGLMTVMRYCAQPRASQIFTAYII